MPFSRKTVVRLAEGAAEAFGHAQLDALFYEYEVQGRDPGSANANKIKRSVALVRGIESDRVFESEAVLLELANRVLANPYLRQNLTALVASLGVVEARSPGALNPSLVRPHHKPLNQSGGGRMLSLELLSRWLQRLRSHFAEPTTDNPCAFAPRPSASS